MNEEKKKEVCGEADQLSGGKICAVGNGTRQAVESTGKVKEEKAPNVRSPSAQKNECDTDMENTKR